MAARAIRDADADYSLLLKQCSSRINCCSFCVRFSAIRLTVGPAERTTTGYPSAGINGSRWNGVQTGLVPRSPRVRPCWPPASSAAWPSAHSPAQPVWHRCRRIASLLRQGLPTALLRPRRMAPTTHRRRWPDPYPRRSPARLRRWSARSYLNRARPTGPPPTRLPQYLPLGRRSRAARREELRKHAHRRRCHPQRCAEFIQHR